MSAGSNYKWRWVCHLRQLPLQRTQRDLLPTGRWFLGWFLRAGQRRPSPDEQGAGRRAGSRGTACFIRHQKYGVPEITKNYSRTEIKACPIAYTHQGGLGGARIFLARRPWAPPARPRLATRSSLPQGQPAARAPMRAPFPRRAGSLWRIASRVHERGCRGRRLVRIS
jgi:hypothetical protein